MKSLKTMRITFESQEHLSLGYTFQGAEGMIWRLNTGFVVPVRRLLGFE